MSERLDSGDLADMAGDRPTCIRLGKVVRVGGGDSPWYELTTRDLRVWVELQPSGTVLLSRMGCVAGGDQRGLWALPPVSCEVVVAIPDGDEVGADPLIIACLSTGSLPVGITVADLLAIPGAGGKVKLGAGEGTGPLAMAANVEARLTRLETQARYMCPIGGGPSSTAILPTLEWLAANPTEPAVIPNGPHTPTGAPGEPPHVHYEGYDGHEEDEPTVNSETPGASGGCAATLVEGI